MFYRKILFRLLPLALICSLIIFLPVAGQNLNVRNGQPGNQQPKSETSESSEEEKAADQGAGPNAGNPAKSKTESAPAKRPTELQKALEEFRIQIGQMGGSGKGTSSSLGRQNLLTGRVYEYLRNDLMDAVPHEVRQRGGTKSLLRRNQFGFTISGPVWVPKAYNGRGKTFFSFSFEGTRERIAQSALFTVPTDSQRLGDFSDLIDNAGAPLVIYDPATTRPNPHYDPAKPLTIDNLQYLRDPFPNNRLPLNRFDPVAAKLVGFYPKANTNVGPFQLNNYWINSPFENRADGVIGKIDHTLTQKQQLSVSFNTSRGLRKSPEFFPGPANSGNPSYNFDNGSLTVQDTHNVSPRVIWVYRGSAAYGKTTSLDAGEDADYPRQLGLNGLFSKFFPKFFFGNYLSIGPRTAVFRDRSYNYSGSASLSINRKAHTLRMTGTARRSYVNSLSPNYPAGLFFFNSSITGLPGIRNTGNNFASFLLGLTSYAEQSIVLHPSYYSKNFFELNAGDEYRVMSGVTINFNLSFEYATPRIEKYDRQSTVSLDKINPANNKPGALVFAGRDGKSRGLQPATFAIEPNIGLAINPWNDRKTVLRLNYGLNFDDYPLYGRHFGTQGFNASAVIVSPNEQLQPAFNLSQGVPNNFPIPPYLDPTAANGTDADFVDVSGVLPAMQQWSLSIQRELPRSLAIEARYNGWRGTHQLVDGFIRLNAVPLSNLSFREQLYDDAFRNSLRPYPQYRNLDLGGVYPGGDLEGHSLTVTLDQRLRGGLFGRFSYRLAKAMDNHSSGSVQNPANLREEWSLSTGDVTHSIQVSYTFELPFGKGRKLLNDGNLVSRVAGGWSLSGITNARGGLPLILRPLFNRSGGIINNLRVNLVPGVDPKVDNQTPERWFNPDAFTQPDDFTTGNGPRTHPQLRGPGQQFHHLSLTKRIELNAETSIEFVTEAFNFPNMSNLDNPDTRIGNEANPNPNAGRIIGSTGGRVMQLGLRLLF